MNNVILNNELTLQYPDGFHVLDEDEMSRIFPVNTPNRWAIMDLDRHLIICVQWQKSSAILARFSSTKDHAKRVVAKARAAYREKECEIGDPYQTSVCGQEAWGVSFSYEVDGVKQLGKVILFKRLSKKTHTTYTVYYYTREESAEENEVILHDALSSVEVI